MPEEIDQRTRRDESISLLDRITHRNLVRSKFYKSDQKLINLRHRPASSLSPDEQAAIQTVIDRVTATLDAAIANPTIDTINAVLDLPEIKVYSFADRATMTRIRRRSPRDQDCLLLSQAFTQLRDHMNGIEE